MNPVAQEEEEVEAPLCEDSSLSPLPPPRGYSSSCSSPESSSSAPKSTPTRSLTAAEQRKVAVDRREFPKERSNMSEANVEIDFFQMEKLNNASSSPSSPERAPSNSFRGIQSLVSRINPQLLKTVMAAGQARSSDGPAACPRSSNPPSPSRATSPPLDLPAHRPSPWVSSLDHPGSTAPMTIFYNGAVVTVNVPRRKAEAIMRMAETGVDERSEEALQQLAGDVQLEGDLPIARKKSLHRFLEKRKERLVSASPYHKFMASCPC